MCDSAKTRKPCNECPFTRTNKLGPTCSGAFDPDQVIAQAHGPFWLPCHKDSKYQGKQSDPSQVIQCAGAAIYRTHVEQKQILGDNIKHLFLELPADRESVFAHPAEFLSYHKGISLNAAALELVYAPLFLRIRVEMVNQQNRFMTQDVKTP